MSNGLPPGNFCSPRLELSTVPRTGWAGRAWWPIPLLLAVIAALWVADLRTVCESRIVMTLLNLVFTWLASICICFLTARGFLGSGQPGLLMFGCGSLLWGVTSLAAAVVVDRVNTTITVHNLGVFGAALCHLVGLLWRGRLLRPGRWLVVGFAGALLSAALIFMAAADGLTPPFFVQGQGGTWLRQIVLVLAIAIFAWVAWQMVRKSPRQSGAFYYWYGLGLALVATGLTGVLLLSIQGGILGWANRLTQYLGSAYLLFAAVSAARETGTWSLALSATEDAWLREELLPAFPNQRWQSLVPRYGSVFLAMVAGFGLRLAVTAWVGPGVPPYLLFAPMVMVVAVFAGFGPGLLAALLSDLVVVYWILPPAGRWPIASPIDRLGLIVYTGVALFGCAIVELYRRNRDKAAAFDREAAARDERNRAEQALGESEERYRQLFETAQEGFYLAEAIFDDTGNCCDAVYLAVNPAFERIVGKPREKILGKRIKELVPEIKPEWMEVFGKVTQTGEAVCHQSYSEVFQQHFEAVVFRPAPKQFGVLVTDISERKNKEKELHRLNRILMALSRSSQAMNRATHEQEYIEEVCKIVVQDCGHRMVWVGFAEDDKEKSIRPVAHAGIEEDYMQTLRVTWGDTERGRGPAGIAIRTGKPGISRHMRTDPAFGPWRDRALQRGYESAIALPLMANGRAFGIVALYSNEPDRFSDDEVKLLSQLADDLAYGIVTIRLRLAKSRAETALRESEQSLRTLGDNLPGGAIYQHLQTADGCVYYTYMSAGIERIFGMSAMGVMADPGSFRKLIFEEDLLRCIELEERSAQELTPFDCEFRQRTVTGELKWVHCRSTPRRLDNGATLWDGIVMDITKRKRIEEENRALTEAMEERSAELAASNQELEAFSYSVSHDLRTPLRTIDGFAQALGEDYGDKLDAGGRDQLQRIRGASLRMGMLIEGLLGLSRMGRMEMKKQEVDLSALARVIAAGFQASDGHRKVEFHITEGMWVSGDAPLLRTVLENLLGNAWKFTAKRPEANIEFSVCEYEAKPAYFVRDNGAGFNMAFADRLFGVFQRLHKPSDFPGTGIGLATVQRIVHRHGGRVWAESEVDKGATFFFTLS